jgi:transposase
MKQLPVVGVDISKLWFDVYIPSVRLKEQFPNDINGFKLFLKQLKKHRIVQARVCMEATGLYFEALAEFLYANGHEVVVVNPQCIKSFARCELRRSKSDPLDAALIAQYCQEKYAQLNLWKPLEPEYKKIRELLRRRAVLVADSTAEKCRLKAGFSCKDMLDSIKRHLAWLKEEIKKVERLVKETIAAHPELSKAVALVTTIKGLRWLTAATVLVEVPQILWDGRLAAAFAGLVPHKDQSGSSRNFTYLSKVGSEHLRAALYMPALSAARTNPLLKPFYDRLRKRGLKHKQALSAVMRKILHLVFGVLTSGTAFDQHYEKKRRLQSA